MSVVDVCYMVISIRQITWFMTTFGCSYRCYRIRNVIRLPHTHTHRHSSSPIISLANLISTDANGAALHKISVNDTAQTHRTTRVHGTVLGESKAVYAVCIYTANRTTDRPATPKHHQKSNFLLVLSTAANQMANDTAIYLISNSSQSHRWMTFWNGCGARRTRRLCVYASDGRIFELRFSDDAKSGSEWACGMGRSLHSHTHTAFIRSGKSIVLIQKLVLSRERACVLARASVNKRNDSLICAASMCSVVGEPPIWLHHFDYHHRLSAHNNHVRCVPNAFL